MKYATKRALVVATAVASLAGAAQVIAAPAANADVYYGAIAVANDGTTGRAWDYPTAASARQAAINSCGYTDCDVLTTFSNGCGAVAYRSRVGWSGGSGYTLYSARAAAISRNGGGYITTWVCTTGHG